MSERMTVEARREYVNALNRREWAPRDHVESAQEEVNATFDRLKQAILDEGLKEERARVDGLVKALRSRSMSRVPGRDADHMVCDLCSRHWFAYEPEQHADGCLCALAESRQEGAER